MKTLSILGLVIVILLLILFIMVLEKIKSLLYREKHIISEEDYKFKVGNDFYSVRQGEEIEIGPGIKIVFSKNTQATVRVRGDVQGSIVTCMSDVTVTGDISGEIRTGSGDVIINGDTRNISTGSGDVVINGNCHGSVISNSGNISIEKDEKI